MKIKLPSKKINKLIDGELTKEEKNNLLLHMSKCENCKKEYQSLLFLKGLLSHQKTIEPSDYFIPKVLRGIKSREFSLPFTELIAKKAWSLIVIFSFVIFLALGIFIYADLTVAEEEDFSESYENLLLADNGDVAAEPAFIEVSSEDIW